MSARVTLRARPTGAGWALVALTVAILGLLLVVPLLTVFSVALREGIAVFAAAIFDPDTAHAARLTLLTVVLAVPINAAFGIVCAWAVTKFDFWGKSLLVALVDLPMAVSPVVAGLLLVLLFGASRGLFGDALQSMGIQVLFSPTAIVLATVFVTCPYVVRELIPLMESLGRDEELAAMSLGASGWQIFTRITLPNIRWGLIHGVVICAARAIGEFGAVSVVSGHIRGETNTLPLHIEVLYNDYAQTEAFAVASMLSLVGMLALLVKVWLERKFGTEGSAQ